MTTIFKKCKNPRLNFFSGLKFIIIVFLSMSQLSCEKLVETDPPAGSITQANAYTNDATAITVLSGLYTRMGTSVSFCSGNTSISLLAGLSADEWTLFNGVTDNKQIAYFQNQLSVNPAFGSEFWEQMYTHVFICNSAIEGINGSSTLTSSVKRQLLGESKFIRAMIYYYLVNLFGETPLALSTDYIINARLPRASKTDVYRQIVTDLIEAQTLLAEDFLDGSLHIYNSEPERVRPTKWAATALLSRVYLFINQYANAELQATAVINNNFLFGLTSLSDVFLKNSREAIWQLQPVQVGHNTEDGWFFNLSTTGPSDYYSPVYLSDNLMNSFEPGDERKLSWVKTVTTNGITYNGAYKYKKSDYLEPVTEYQMVLRLAEQYLIRSEARTHLNNYGAAASDLNIIRSRAGLSNTTAFDKTSLLTAINKERRMELFTEWGHRWLDLKRTNTVDSVMSTVTTQKGGTWHSYQQWYPILFTDIQKNPQLLQNLGY